MRQIKTERAVDDRKGWLGGSSWGAALGFSTYSTPLEIAREYLGEKREVSSGLQERFDMGHALEGFVASQAERKYGIKVQNTKWLYLSPSDIRLGCHPDRLVKGKVDGKSVAIEIKSSSAFDSGRWGDEDTDEVPYDYLIQCYSYFECVGVDEVWLIRFSNNSLTRYIIGKPSDETMRSIVSKLVAFMDDADNGILPEPASYAEAVSSYTEPREGDTEPDDEVLGKIQRWGEIKKAKKALEEEEDSLKKGIVAFLSDRGKTRIVDSSGRKLASYLTVATTRLDTRKLKEVRPDIYEEFSYQSTSNQLR